MERIRVLVCDDHEVLRKGITQLLKNRADFEVVGEASNGSDAVSMADTKNPDVIIMDVQMPKMDGIEATAAIREKNKDVKIVMLTISDEEDDLFNAIKKGANGYLLKNLSLNDLFSCLHRVYKGEPQFSDGLAGKILDEFSRLIKVVESEGDQYRLGDREKDALELVAKGKTNKEIAELLFISQHTVKKHLQNILAKLHVNNRAEAATLAIKEGIINNR